ncbi:MAG: ammonium transporter [bacterium]|nr:ammonium transporter [bacterium]
MQAEHSLQDVVWILLCSGLVLLMQGGFLCLETGLIRAKNSINVALKNIVDLCVGSFVYWSVGFALMFGVSTAGLIGTTDFLFSTSNDAWWTAVFVFQLFFCTTAATIVSGAIAERTRFSSYLITTVLVCGLIYPVIGHWIWGGLSGIGSQGWLAEAGFIDFAGATAVHSVGGWVALAAVLAVGPRKGRFDSETDHPIIGHNLPLSGLGVLLLLVGFIGFNAGSTLSLDTNVSAIVLRTILAGATGGAAMLVISRVYDGLVRPDRVMNGLLTGLVAITASCNFVTEIGAVIIGLVAAPVYLGMSVLLERLQIDDAIPIHAGGGVWGALSVALLGTPEIWGTGLGRVGQLSVQLMGCAVAFAWAFGIAFVALHLLKRFTALRVSEEEEEIGLNVSEHGAGSSFSIF